MKDKRDATNQEEEDIILAVDVLDRIQENEGRIRVTTAVEVVAGYDNPEDILRACESVKHQNPLALIMYVFEGEVETYHNPEDYISRDNINT